jgi:predicted N-formylglutamate amidohydrolase
MAKPSCARLAVFRQDLIADETGQRPWADLLANVVVDAARS